MMFKCDKHDHHLLNDKVKRVSEAEPQVRTFPGKLYIELHSHAHKRMLLDVQIICDYFPEIVNEEPSGNNKKCRTAIQS